MMAKRLILLFELISYTESLSWWETSITIFYHTVCVTILNNPTVLRSSQLWILKMTNGKIKLQILICFIVTSTMNTLSCKFPGQISHIEYSNYMNSAFVLLITLHSVYLLVHPNVFPRHKGTMQPLLLLCRAPVKEWSISKSVHRKMTLQCLQSKHILF